MGLRCLLGHDFGEPETERQRNEEGNEVVVTVREVKTCQTCGETRIVSENKEIKSIEQLRRSAIGDDAAYSAEAAGTPGPAVDIDDAPGTAADSPDSATPGPSGTTGDASGPVHSGAPEDADAIQNAERASDSGRSFAEASENEAERPAYNVGEVVGADEDEPADATDVASSSHPATADDGEDDSDVDPDVEDAIILGDDEDTPDESERKQWEETAEPDEIPSHDEPEPESDGDDAVIMGDDAAAEPERTEDGYTPWPTQHAEDEGHDAGIPDGEPASIDFGGGLAPENETESADDTEDESTAPVDDGAEVSRTPRKSKEMSNGTSASSDNSRNGAEKRRSQQTPETSVNLDQSPSEASLEYHCPECGLTRSVGNSSMRAGDICPECRRGYIVEQAKQN